jgi:hypothetical protein
MNENDQDQYIIIGNFANAANDQGPDFTAFESGIGMTEFYGFMRAYAQVHNVNIVEYLEDGVIMRGTPDVMVKLANDTNNRYTCVTLNEELFQKIVKERAPMNMPLAA